METEVWSAEEGAQIMVVHDGTCRGSVEEQGVDDPVQSSSSVSGTKGGSEDPGVGWEGHFAAPSAIYVGYSVCVDGERK